MDGGMIRNTSSLGDILDSAAEHSELHLLCKSGYSEDNILAESETVECNLAVSLLFQKIAKLGKKTLLLLRSLS